MVVHELRHPGARSFKGASHRAESRSWPLLLVSTWLLLQMELWNQILEGLNPHPLVPASVCFSLTCTANWLERSEKKAILFSIPFPKSIHKALSKAGLHSVSSVVFTNPSSSLLNARCSLHFHRSVLLLYHSSGPGTARECKSREIGYGFLPAVK